MGLWKCTKCGLVTSGINRPLTGVCNKGGGHRWTANNSNTPKLWYCAKCGVVTSAANRPNVGVCTKGGRHTWRVRS
jgi:ribosomal protein L37AE/L43A